MRPIDILQSVQWALERGEDARLILDENSPLRDAMREALKPQAPPDAPLNAASAASPQAAAAGNSAQPDEPNEGGSAPSPQGSATAEPTALQARALELFNHDMPWREADQLALSEAGIGDAEIDECLSEVGAGEYVLGLEDLRELVRHVLIHGPRPLDAAAQRPLAAAESKSAQPDEQEVNPRKTRGGLVMAAEAIGMRFPGQVGEPTALEADARRYRWLRSIDSYAEWNRAGHYAADALDKLVDAALALQQEPTP